MSQSLESFARTIQGMVGSVGRKFTRPDEDWMSTLFAQTPNGQIIPTGVVFDAEGKDRAPEYVRERIRELGAVRYALLNSVWQAPVEDDEMPLNLQMPLSTPVREMPGAYEALILLVGDAETEVAWRAKIIRRPRKTPTIRRWEKMESYEGRFTDLASAMREIR
jgi:hypothetical protein